MRVERLLIEGGNISMKPPFGQIIIGYKLNPKKLIDEINEVSKQFKEKKVFIKIFFLENKNFKIEIDHIPTTQIIKDELKIKKITENLKNKIKINSIQIANILQKINNSKKITKNQIIGTCKSMGIIIEK